MARTKSTKAAGKTVAEKKDQLPAGINYEADSGAGMEGVDKDSLAIPFLAIVQKMSPYVDENDAQFIEAARPGMLINTVTLELYDGKDTGVHFLPCAFNRRFLRWANRKAGAGGFKGEFSPEEAARMRSQGQVIEQEGKLFFPDDNGKIDPEKSDILADTRNHFGILLPPKGEPCQVLLSLSSTQIKKSKQLMTLLDTVKVEGKNGKITPPTWANKVKLTTIGESNDKGSWAGLRVELDGFVGSQELYQAGKDFHDLIASGKVEVDYDKAAKDGPTSAEAEEQEEGAF